MKTLLLSTAILAATGFAASAQDLFRGEADPLELRASDLIGMRVYASEAAIEVDETDGMQDDWEDIGEVNDIVLERDGAAQAVLVDVGGFLGLGERQVAVSMEALRFVSDGATADEASDFFLVMNATRADIEGAPDYAALGAGAAAGAAATATAVAATEEGAETVTTTVTAAEGAAVEEGAMATEEMDADAMATDEMSTEDMAASDMATDGATDEATVTGTEPAASTTRVPVTREGYLAAGAEDLTADRLQGAAVYDSSDERVGEVSELILSGDGQVTEVVVDVGGFLGIGEKPVALAMADLDILREDGGEEVRVYLSQTREALDAMESYTGE